MNSLDPNPRPTQYEALEEWEYEAYEQEKFRGSRRYRSILSRYPFEKRDDKMKIWRRAVITEGLYPVFSCNSYFPK